MGCKCEVASCGNAKERTPFKSFFSFPRNRNIYSSWVNFCDNSELTDAFRGGGPEQVRYRKVCSDHFSDDDFVNHWNPRQGIRHTAIPCLKSPATRSIRHCDLPVNPNELDVDTTQLQLAPNEIKSNILELDATERRPDIQQDVVDVGVQEFGFSTEDTVCAEIFDEINVGDTQLIFTGIQQPDAASHRLDLQRTETNDGFTEYDVLIEDTEMGYGDETQRQLTNKLEQGAAEFWSDLPQDVADVGFTEVEAFNGFNFEMVEIVDDDMEWIEDSCTADPLGPNEGVELPSNDSGIGPIDTTNESLKAQLARSLEDNQKLKQNLKKEKRKSSWRLRSMKKKDSRITTLKSKLRAERKANKSDVKLATLVRKNPILHDSLNNSTKKPKGRRYSRVTRKFACGAYMAGPAAYRFIRKSKTLTLPSKRTIGRWNADVRAQPGINLDIMDKLAAKTKKFSTKERAVLIAIDGMSIKADLNYNAKTDIFEGFPSDGKVRKYEKNKTTRLATEAVAVVVSSIAALNSDRWELSEAKRRFKVPIGYLLAHHTMGSEAQLRMLEDVAEQLECRGLHPMVVTVDQCQTNMKMAREAGLTKSNPLIRVNGREMALIFDPPHLLKSMRNNFMKHNMVFNNKLCKFDVIKKLYEIDQASTPRLVPKLVEQCINLPPFGAMSVPRAAATVSSSTAAGVVFYVETGDLPIESLSTAEMVKFHDTLFDVMNSKGLESNKPYRRALEEDSCHWHFMETAESRLKGMYYTTNTCESIAEAKQESQRLTIQQRKPNYIFGFLNNIRALKWLWTRVSTDFGFDHLCTNHLSSDTVENFNSESRRRCGRNDAPNAFEYSNSFKYCAISATQKLADGSNCEQDNAKPLLDDADLTKQAKHTEQPATFKYPFEPLADEYDRGYSSKELNGLMYVVGYASLKIPHKSCRKYLCVQSDADTHKNLLYRFCKLKNASAYPSSKLYEIGLLAFNAYKQKFNLFLYQNRRNVKARLKQYLSFEDYERYTCKQCFNMILDKIFNTLFKSFLKEVRAALKRANAQKRNRKALKMNLP